MIYVLIFLVGAESSSHAIATHSAEFNSAASCQAAAHELQRQVISTRNDTFQDLRVPIIFCAAKGKP